MNKIKNIFLVFSILLFVACNNEIVVVYDISQERFDQELVTNNANNEKYIIIDTRPEHEYLNGHLFGAMNYNIKILKTRFYEIEDLKNIRTYVYGNNSEESFKVAKYLGEQGFKTIFNCAGLDEAEYPFVFFNPVRLKRGFQMAKENNYQLVDYRRHTAREKNMVKNSNFILYPNIDQLLNVINYSSGYVVFSANVKNATECAAELSSYGFKNVYYCVDDIANYPEFWRQSKKEPKTP
ncbi:MAG: rhodanese-like domain-containing protein [Treponemataceae bacterium]